MQREITAVCIPLISAHIKFLNRCLLAIKNQKRAPDQIHISVSSCSANHSKEISELTENLGMTVNVHPQPEPLLAGANRNRAAAEAVKAGATLLFFFDADDIMHKQRIDIITRYFEERRHITGILNRFIFGPKDKLNIDYATIPWRPFTDIIHENAFTFVDTPNDFKSQYLKPEIYKTATSSGMNFVACAAITVRAEFWQKWPYDETIKIGEDQHFNSRIVTEGMNLSYIPDDLSVYSTSGRTEFDCMCSCCEKLRPVQSVPTHTDLVKLIKEKHDIHLRLTNLKSIVDSLQTIDMLSKHLEGIKQRIQEIDVPRIIPRPIHPDSAPQP